jgi:uncharacterized YccA/Bax inhibitor family protein
LIHAPHRSASIERGAGAGRLREDLATGIVRGAFPPSWSLTMRSGNPVLGENTFLDVGSGRVVTRDGQTMTIGGTVNKTALLLAMVLITAAYTWSLYSGPDSLPTLVPYVWVGGLGGFAMALVTVFKKTWSPVTAPIYALLKGLFLGAISAVFEAQFPGIVMQAVGLTFGTLASLLLAYKSGLIRATENFKLGVVAATGGIFLLYLVNFGLRAFGFEGMGFIHDSGLIGIAFSAFVVVIAALNLVLDFDFIESGVDAGAPKYMEWFGAFGLMVTLIWLYLEILRLLAKLRGDD